MKKDKNEFRRKGQAMREKIRRAGFAAIFFLLAVMLFAFPVSAKKSYSEQWVMNAKGNVSYYDANGKKLKGMQKIGKKYYYFDSKGIQRTGWQKIKGNYYYFKIANKAKGSRVGSKTINGIKLRKNGKAKLNAYSKRKLALMVRANKIIESITNAKMTKKQKLEAAFAYTKQHLQSYNRGGFQSGGDWDMFYAEIPFNTGRADCYSYGAYFAYLANAAGGKAAAVSSGGHGWAEVDGLVYDANWAKASHVDTYCGMSYSLSGVGGRPNYRPNRRYVKAI